MALFSYTVLGEDAKRRNGTIEAPSRELALGRLRDEGLTPLVVEPLKEPTNVEDILARFRPVPLTTLVTFMRQLATMIDSGMQPLRALSTMEESEENPKFRDILHTMGLRVEAGVRLADAFAEHPTTFLPLHIAMLRAGEQSGQLPNALKELATQLEKQLRLRRAIKSATVYPKIVMIASFFIVSGMLIFIIPMFAKMFVQVVQQTQSPGPNGKLPNASLPLPTEVLYQISLLLYPQGTKNIGWMLDVLARMFGILAVFGLVIPRSMRALLRQPGPREQWDSIKLRFPMRIGPLVQKIAVARFSRTFASLLSAGVPAQEAMEIVADAAGNVLISRAILEARERMLAGATIAEPLARAGVFPSMVTRMIEVGEETGQLEEMLVKVAEFYEEEVDLAIKGLTSIIEPGMVMLLGGIIGTIVISCYLPMFKLYSLFGTGTGGATSSGGMTISLYLLKRQASRMRQGLHDYRRYTEIAD